MHFPACRSAVVLRGCAIPPAARIRCMAKMCPARPFCAAEETSTTGTAYGRIRESLPGCQCGCVSAKVESHLSTADVRDGVLMIEGLEQGIRELESGEGLEDGQRGLKNMGVAGGLKNNGCSR